MNKPLSASRIKTLQSCSWKYYCNYILKLPDETNDGALRGSCVHNIFECLGNPRHKNIYNVILEQQDAFAHPTIKRYVESYANENGLTDEFNMNLLNEMIVEGINCDFYGDSEVKPDVSLSEKDFDISVDDGTVNYRILGFIDKLFLFKKKSEALIRDFKTSKAVFQGDDITDNIQDIIYKLAVKHLYPDYYKRKMQFLFLRFDCKNDGNVITPDLDEDEMRGFELFLTEIQKVVNNFTEEDAKNNFAWDKGYPTQEQGFSGRLLCGYAKYPMQKRKNGEGCYFFCPYKFPYNYYVLLDESGDTVKSSKNLLELEELKKHHTGLIIEKKSYEGCPAAYNKAWVEADLKKDGVEADDINKKWGYNI